MNTAPIKPIAAVQVAAFLKRYLPEARDWSRAKLLPWVVWFMRRDRALVLTDDREKIQGVALGRFVFDAADVDAEPYLFDAPDGPLVWVDAIATKHPAALPQLIALLPLKYGERHQVAGHCFSRDGELRMFPMKTLQRFFGINHT